MKKSRTKRWMKHGMAVTLSVAMSLGLCTGFTVPKAVYAATVDADFDGNANETIDFTNANGIKLVKLGNYIKNATSLQQGHTYYFLRLSEGSKGTQQQPDYNLALEANQWMTVSESMLPVTLAQSLSSPSWSDGVIQSGDTYFKLLASQNPEFKGLFDTCDGTIAFNETFNGDGTINETDGKYSHYACDGGGIDDQPILLYEASEEAEYTLDSIYAENKKTYLPGQTISKDDFTIYAKYTDGKGNVKWATVDKDYVTLSKTVASAGDNTVKVNFPTKSASTSVLLTGSKSADVSILTSIPSGESSATPVTNGGGKYGEQLPTNATLTAAQVVTKACNYNNEDKSSAWAQYAKQGDITYSVGYDPVSTWDEYTDGNYTNIATDVSETDMKAALTHAGKYKVTAKVPFQVAQGGEVTYRTYSYYVTIDQADLAIKDPIDYVSSAVDLASHTTKVYLEGKNGEQVLGNYTYPGAVGRADADNKDVSNLKWNFNFPSDMNVNDYNPAPITGTNGRVIYKLKELPATVTVNDPNKNTYGDDINMTAAIDDKNYGIPQGETWTYQLKDKDGNPIGNPVTVTDTDKKDGNAAFAISGLDAGDYTVETTFDGNYITTDGEAIKVTGIQSTDITVDKRVVTLKAQRVDKTYDGSNLVYTINSKNGAIEPLTLDGQDALNNMVAGDKLTVTAQGTYAEANVGVDRAITWSKIDLTGDDVENYSINTENEAGFGTIAKATSTIKHNELFYLTIGQGKDGYDVKNGIEAVATATMLQRIDESKPEAVDNVKLEAVEIQSDLTYELVDDLKKPDGLAIAADGKMISPATVTTNDNRDEQDVWPRVKVTIGANGNFNDSEAFTVPYAVLGYDEYEVIFKDLEDGTIEDATWENFTYVSQNGKVLPVDVEREGYTFANWTTLAGGLGVPVIAIEEGTEGKQTFYANWDVVTYDITYNLNGGINDEDNVATYNIESEDITLKNPTKKGYSFEGWYTTEDFKEDSKITDIKTGSTGAVEVYASWKPINYDITYNLNGGTNDKDNVATYNIESEDITLKSPTKKGYSFEGWYTTEELKESSKITDIKKGSTGAVEVYASWKPINYDIKYNLNGGENDKDNVDTYNIESEDITFKAPTKKGYSFEGWYTTKDFKADSKITDIKKGSTEAVTVYAKWSLIEIGDLTLNQTSATMKPGDEKTLKVTVKPEDVIDQSVVWKSSNSKIATVDQNGNVIAIKAGTVTITVTSKDGKHAATCIIKVKPSVLVLSGNPKKAKSAELKWTTLKNADGYEIYGNFCSTDLKYLEKVGKTNHVSIGKLKGKKLSKKGEYKFVVRGYKMIGGKKVYLAKSNVIHVRTKNTRKEANATGVTVEKKSVTLKVKGTSYIKRKAVLPKGKKQMKGHGELFRFVSSDKSVATVSSKGTIKAKGKGICTIYVLSLNGKYAKVSVTVK